MCLSARGSRRATRKASHAALTKSICASTVADQVNTVPMRASASSRGSTEPTVAMRSAMSSPPTFCLRPVRAFQKRRQNHLGGPGAHAPDQFLWGPGEGAGVKDTSLTLKSVQVLPASKE